MSTDEQKADVVAWQWRYRDWARSGSGTNKWSDWLPGRIPVSRPFHEDREERALYSQATITALQERIKELEGALGECQRALATLIAPEAIQATTVINAFAQVTAAEWAARSTLKDSGNGSEVAR